MRPLDQLDSSSLHSRSKRKKKTRVASLLCTNNGGPKHSSDVMQYQDSSGKEGHQGQQQQQQQQQQQRSYLQEARQPQHRGLYAQQPQSATSSHLSSPASSSYSRGNAYAQQPPPHHTHPDMDLVTTATQQALEREYLQQQQQQQYMNIHHHPYGTGGYTSAAAAAAARQYAAQQQQQHQAMSYQQQMSMQQQYAAAGAMYPGMDPTTLPPTHPHLPPQLQHQLPHPHHLLQQQQLPHHSQPIPYLQPKVGRLPADRPLIKLSVSLIDTYKHINTIYYEERDARKAARAKESSKAKSSAGHNVHSSNASQGAGTAATSLSTGAGGGAGGGGGESIASAMGSRTTNNGWDDENYDYIITPGELFYGRYRIKERIGKGSFGQVVKAEDTQELRDVAIKIIKSKKPFLMQAKTEIELLTHLNNKDVDDQNNIVRLITHFMYRNHQCLVFEMLSLNLYELLKNTQFGGVSLNLIRKFAKQVLRSLSFLARKDVDVIHCDLKPENILLRHPKKSGIKVIDFGSSCKSNKRMYSYIQSRFYRSPEVMLGLPYAVSIDMWSLGCILAEMHTGEPLFSGSDQFDQMQKVVKLLGMVPSSILDQANDQHRLQFFELVRNNVTGREEWMIKQHNTGSSSRGGGSASSSPASKQQGQPDSGSVVVIPSNNPIASLSEVIRAETNRKKKYPPSETGNSPRNYELFVDLIYRMLAYDPRQRIKPDEALNHPFITEQIK